MRDGIFQVRQVRAWVEPHRWRWAHDNREMIAAHWRERKTARPAIFNGRVLMIAESRIDGDTLTARFFETDYASLLTWLDLDAPDRGVENGFAMGALTAADGAYLLGVMGPHTSQAGRIYFPAGTPDLTDVRPDGTVDLLASITREIEEETGLTGAAYVVDDDWTVVRVRGYTALLRAVRVNLPAEEARSAILRHLAREEVPELADIRVARGLADLDPAMPEYLSVFLRWRFGGSEDGIPV